MEPRLPNTKPVRKRQKRAEITKRRLLEAATEQFSFLGFEAVPVAAIEEAAGVQRGLLPYHYGSKDELWKEVVDRLFAGFYVRWDQVSDTVKALPDVDLLSALIAGFVRFSAECPELQRIIIQESKLESWRMEYLVDTHVKGIRDRFESLIERTLTAHDYYILVGASSFIFSAQQECKRLWDTDPCTEEFATKHAGLVAGLMKQHFSENT
jgi:AcrR family transcriptional regulator